MKNLIKLLILLCPFLLHAQSDCVRPQILKIGEIFRYSYPTDYYTDSDTFDFPIYKVWRGQAGDRIWNLSIRFANEKVVTQPNHTLAAPDTLRFERFIKATGKSSQYQLTRFLGDIYQVWKISQTSYAWPGQHTTLLIPIEVRTFERIYRGWPDDYMNSSAYKTDSKQVLKQIEKYRCKDYDAGRRKAGTN